MPFKPSFASRPPTTPGSMPLARPLPGSGVQAWVEVKSPDREANLESIWTPVCSTNFAKGLCSGSRGSESSGLTNCLLPQLPIWLPRKACQQHRDAVEQQLYQVQETHHQPLKELNRPCQPLPHLPIRCCVLQQKALKSGVFKDDGIQAVAGLRDPPGIFRLFYSLRHKSPASTVGGSGARPGGDHESDDKPGSPPSPEACPATAGQTKRPRSDQRPRGRFHPVTRTGIEWGR